MQDFKFAASHALRTTVLASIATWIVTSLTTTLAATQTARSSLALPSDGEIRKILAERVGAQEGSIGIVVGVIEPQGRKIISYGHRNAGDPRPLDGDTVFEIGSVTKVFTALLLADMVAKNEVALAEPMSQVYSYRQMANRWRHYDKWGARLDGFVALGDSSCAFNPVYGQGMTSGALSALMLGECLEQNGINDVEVPRKFFAAQALFFRRCRRFGRGR